MSIGSKEQKGSYVKGIFHILLSAFFFSLMTVCVRASGDVPTMQKVFFRNLIAAIVAVIILLRTPEKLHIKKGSIKYLLLRSIFGGAGLVANFWAIDHIGIADANLLNKMSPFFATIMSMFILSEYPSVLDIICIIIAFVGAAFVIKPTSGLASLPALSGLFGGFGAGTAYTYVRKLGNQGERGPVIVAFFSIFTTAVALPFVIFQYVPMSTSQLIYLLLAGCCAAIAQLNVTAAYTNAPASKISVFDYTQVIFAAAWGMIFFGEFPDKLSIIGYAIVIGVSIFKYFTEKNAILCKKIL